MKEAAPLTERFKLKNPAALILRLHFDVHVCFFFSINEIFFFFTLGKKNKIQVVPFTLKTMKQRAAYVLSSLFF